MLKHVAYFSLFIWSVKGMLMNNQDFKALRLE